MNKILVCAFTCLLGAASAWSQATTAPRHTASGGLALPADYREWIFLSAGLGMNYSPGGNDANPHFDNVFVTRPAYSEFLKTGKWPDKTMFILEIRSSESHGSINLGGHYQAGLTAREAEVKENGQWTFYSFPTGAQDGASFPRTERCYSCHAANGAVDNTFVQFYPTLIPVAQQHGTYKAPPPGPLAFTEHVIASDLRSGYHVSVADLNHDGRPDIIALAQGGPDLVWYENTGNPTALWQRHVLVSGLPHMINCAPGDPGPDGIPDIVVAWEFANDASKSIGKVGVLHHDGDPRQPWKLQQIDEIPTSHRIRWADIDGSGKKVALNAVLTGPRAAPPNYSGDHAPLVLYRPGEWKREVIDNVNEGVQHGILVTRWNRGDTQDSILTASFSGIHLYQWGQKGWKRTEIAKGDAAPCPKCGSSDVALGYLGQTKFLAAIEPWHGNQVAIYSPKGAGWERSVIDDSLVDGHTVIAADFDGDGRDEVVVGFRQGAKSVYLYKADDTGHWTRQVLDNGGMPGAACASADFNGDGALDIVCIGGASLKWYENKR
jgi:hypothetical protein